MQHEEKAIRHSERLTAKAIYEVVRRDGEQELHRPRASLLWSGMTAGLLISFSVLGEAVFRAHLPDVPARHLLENLGYTFGFLLVILGRMQLFTENTITTVVPALMTPSREMLRKVSVLWGTVLLANVIGAFVVAIFFAYAPVLEPDVRAAFTDLSQHATGMPWAEGLMRGIPAGVLIAALVWMMPAAPSGQIALIVIFTWLIALGDFTHIVAGSVEMAFLAVQGMIPPGEALFGFFLPVLAGNVLGGTVVFTLLAWAQIRPEVEQS
jgi:formate/nitrite transporter FocA (FNT family)